MTVSNELAKVENVLSSNPSEMRVLEDSPLVLSMGTRCMDQGYSFVWPAGRNPYLLNEEGDMIKLKVKEHIPYLHQFQQKESPEATEKCGHGSAEID